jgi:DNA-directed RNA polymerase subunit RPC12/RpoP
MGFKLNIYPEYCCDECNSVIHNHLDCIQCGKEYADSSQYGDIWSLEVGDELECEHCKATYLLLNKSEESWDFENWLWELKAK